MVEELVEAYDVAERRYYSVILTPTSVWTLQQYIMVEVML